MVKKVVKRKIAETESAGKPVEQPLTTYQAGGLSNLFGKSTDGGVLQEDVVQGAAVIEKPKRRKYNPKEGEKEEGNEAAEADNTDENGEKKPKSDRSKQRENHKKKQTIARSQADENAKTIYIGNVPLTVDEKAIRKIFSEYGKIDSIRMRGLIPKNEKLTKRVTHLTGKLNENQKSVIFYVKFEEKESVEKALKYNGTKLEENIIRVDKCAGKKDFGKDLAVFVGNLPFDITENALAAFFTEHVGPVEAVRIVRDKNTGKGKGFAFVNFKEDSSVGLALGMETIKMDKRDLRITKVMKKMQITKVQAAKKRHGNDYKKKAESEITGKMENFKFSTKKPRTDEQNERRGLKKSAQKAIKKKKAAKQGRLMQ